MPRSPVLAALLTLFASSAAAAACPDDLDPAARRACLEAELSALDGAAGAAAGAPSITPHDGRRFRLNDEVVDWRAVEPILAQHADASPYVDRAGRKRVMAWSFGAASLASVAAGAVMFANGGLGSGNAGSGIRAAGAFVGAFGGGGFLTASLVSRSRGRRLRSEAVEAYGQ